MTKITVELPDVIAFKHDGTRYEVKVADIHESNLPALFTYGTRRRLQDPLNSRRKQVRDAGGAWNADREVKAMLDAFAEENGLARATGGGTVSDPVAVEAIRLAKDYIKAKTGVKTDLQLADHAKGAKYVNVTEKGSVTPNVAALLEFVDANEDKLGFRARAKAIVDARNAPADADVDI